MGHDISAYSGDREVAHLQRTIANPKAPVIYKAFNAERFNAGCSGIGAHLPVTSADLEAALQRLDTITMDDIKTDPRATALLKTISGALNAKVIDCSSPSTSSLHEERAFILKAIKEKADAICFM